MTCCNWSKSACSCDARKQISQMFLASVICGRSKDYGGSKDDSLSRPPPLESDPTQIYHSVNSTVAGRDKRMFVVWHNDQAYPRYVLTYRQQSTLFGSSSSSSGDDTHALAAVANWDVKFDRTSATVVHVHRPTLKSVEEKY